MKKIFVLLSIMVLFLGIRNVNAAEMKQKSSTANTIYGTVKVLETDGWEAKPDGSNYIRQSYSFTRTLGGYIYVTLLETKNVKVDINSIMVSSAFELVGKKVVDGGVDLVIKLKDGASISDATYAFELAADIVDPTDKNCALNYSPNPLACAAVGDAYFDDQGVEVTEEVYKQACENYVPEEPVPDIPNTGSFIPYIAVGVGIVLIGSLFYYSRKSNKFYKI